MAANSPARKLVAEAGRGQDGPPSLRAQFKQLTTERLISCAIELFTDKGFQATSVAEIAAAAGTTSTTFYRYFATKAEIGKALHERMNVDVQRTLDSFDAIPEYTLPAIRDWIHECSESWGRMDAMSAAYWDAARSDPSLTHEFELISQRMTGSLKAVKAIPTGPGRTRFQTRFLLMYMLMGRLLSLMVIQGRDTTSSAMVDEFAKLFCETLFGHRSRQ
jgi:AcrR family transcriptional regulator